MLQQAPLPQPHNQYDRTWAANLVRSIDAFIYEYFQGPRDIQGELTTDVGRTLKLVAITATPYTILSTDDVVDVNVAGTVALTLPTTAGFRRGKRIMVQDSSGGASGNTITINKSSDANVNGGASVTLTTDYGRLLLIFNGTQWISA